MTRRGEVDPEAPTAASAAGATLTASHGPGVVDEPRLDAGVLIGRYRIDGVLGEGGMGIVYRAHDPDLDRPVAIKVLRAGLRGARARLLREGQAIARLAHRNVVTVFDVGVTGDDLFIAMELVEGGTLRGWRGGRWSETVAVYAQAARGLGAAHAAGIVHRDFKPDNVLLARDGRAVVSDFGIAQQDAGEPPPHALLETAATAGTPAYMAPEQFRGEPADARSDQFSFCVALWEALYGERPFRTTDKTVPALAAAVAAGHITEVRDRRGVPAHVHAALRRGLSAKPSARFPSIEALLAAIETRRRGAAIAVGAAVVLVVAAIALVIVLTRPTPESPLVRAPSASCPDPSSVWSADARAAVPAAQLPWFDAYARRLGALASAACLAPRAPNDPRMACLARAIDDLKTAVHRSRDLSWAWPALHDLAACADPAAAARIDGLGEIGVNDGFTLSPDRSRFVWATASVSEIHRIDAPSSRDDVRQLDGAIHVVAWTAAGIVANRESGTVLIDPSTGKDLRTLSADYAFAISDDLRVGVFSDRLGKRSIVSLDGGPPRFSLEPDEQTFDSAAFSPDRERLVVLEHGERGYQLRVHRAGGTTVHIDPGVVETAIGVLTVFWLDDRSLVLAGSAGRDVQGHVWRLPLADDGTLAGPPVIVVDAAPDSSYVVRDAVAGTLLLDRTAVSHRLQIVGAAERTPLGMHSAEVPMGADRDGKLVLLADAEGSYSVLTTSTWVTRPLSLPADRVGTPYQLGFRGHTIAGLGYLDDTHRVYFELDDDLAITRVVDVDLPPRTILVCAQDGCVAMLTRDGKRTLARVDGAGLHPLAIAPPADASYPLQLSSDGRALAWLGDTAEVQELATGKTTTVTHPECMQPQYVEFVPGRHDLIGSCVNNKGTWSLLPLDAKGRAAPAVLESPDWISGFVPIDTRYLVSSVGYQSTLQRADLAP